jgi:hypothetical protein
MKLQLILLIVAVSFPPCLHCQSEFPEIQTSDTTLVLQYDEDMTPYGQYLHVTRYFSDAAPYYVVGEVCIIRSDGDTIDVRWDRTPGYGGISNIFRVYNGSGAFQNELKTLRFDVASGDTLKLYHTGDVQHPPVNPDGSARTFEQDTTFFAIPDTVFYLLELIDESSGLHVMTLDSIVYLPAQSFFDYCSNIVESVFDTNYIGFRHYQVTRTEGIDLQQGSYRIHLTPRSSTMTDGVDSMFFAYYDFSPRVTKTLNMIWDSLVMDIYQRMLYIDDSLSGAAKRRYHIEEGLVQTDFRVYPTIIDRSYPVFSVTGVDPALYDALKLRIYTVDGRLLTNEEITKVSTSGIIDIRLSHHVQPGPYLVVIQSNDTFSTQLILIK